jgi:hypothetical protein
VEIPVFSATFIEEAVFFFQCILGSFVKNQMDVVVWVKPSYSSKLTLENTDFYISPTYLLNQNL